MLAFPSNHYKEKAIRNKSTPKLGAYDTSTVDQTPAEDKKPNDINTDKTMESGIKSPQCGETHGLKFWLWKIVEMMKKAW